MVIKTNNRGEGLQTFVDCVNMGIIVRPGTVNGKPGDRITLSGKRLHDLMTKLWPYLPVERKKDYARVRRASAQ